jgi:multiple sugar transport system substrate-binding protein/raffinose/stachyose/melibiose transport system substrate-binding protein
VHYFGGDMGKAAMTSIIDGFNKSQQKCEVVDNTTGHEDFKTQILVMLAGDNPPDIFSNWAGARTEFVQKAGRLLELSDFWKANNLDKVLVPGIQSAANYNGGVYAIPQNYHFTGLFYNPKVMAKAGITEMPKTYEEFLAMAEKLKASGVTPFALGSKDRWPAYFWFDFLLSYTAGHDYRAKLQSGQASFEDPEVVKAMEMWKELVDKGYFTKDPNGYIWTDAADQVAKGEAAMTLMGTFITGYWDGNGLKPGTDYDMFPFPQIDPKVDPATFASVDAWEIPKDAKNGDCGKELIKWFLTPENQKTWAVGQGALAASTQVDPAMYNSVMAKANDLMASGTKWFAGYDLSTPPPNAEVGLNMFAQFMNDPSKYMDYLKEAQKASVEAFKGLQ